MKLFFDTEFCDLIPNARLISIALVDENENFFYAELTDTYQVNNCSEFVKLWVLPILRGDPYKMTWDECAIKLAKWIEDRNVHCCIASDNPAWDVPYLNKLLKYRWPENLDESYYPIYVPHDVQERLVIEGELHIHNALDDALVMKRAEMDK